MGIKGSLNHVRRNSETLKYRLFNTRSSIRRKSGHALIRLGRMRRALYIKKIDGKRKLVVSERHASKVKILSRILLVASIITAFVTLSAPYSVILSLALIITEQILERTAFYFTSVLIVDFPDWATWKKAGFIAMVFARPESDKAQVPLIVGMAFTDEDAAREVWSYIESWAGSEQDGANNLSVSIIINKKASAYALFVYPSYNRPAAQKMKKTLNARKANRGKDHIQLQGNMMIVKVFPLRDNSSLSTVFLPNYKDKDTYIFRPYVYKDNDVDSIRGIRGILKDRLKVKEVHEVTRKDPEFHSVKYDINWNSDPRNVPQSFHKTGIERFD